MDKKCHIWETEELCSINICPLVTAPFAVQWSPDNQISLITEGGVHVLELQPSPMSPNPTVKFTRSFVNPSDTLPAYAFATEMESLVWKLERQEIYSLLMEEAITPKLNEKCTESDRIGINHFHIVHKDKSHIKILAAKGIFLLLLCINWTGSLKSIKYLRTKEFNITGINSITAQKFLISTQDAHVFVVDIQSDELVLTNITTHLPQTRVQYLGLAHSPNKVMFVNITSPSMSFDHLVVKEPSTIHVFALKSVDPLPIVNNSTSLTNIWDCMEMLRVKAAKAEDPSTVLCTTTTTEKPESLHNLRVSMWMTVMMNVCKVKKPIPNIDHIRQSKISRELPLIYVHFACAYLDNLTKKGSRKRKSILSNDQKIAIGLLRKYLNIYLTNEDNDDEEDERDEKARRCARETLKATASCITMMEKCNLCCETINELSRDVTSCPSGHKLPRCAITLLQITSLEYRVCRICGQMFHSCLEQVSQEPCCQFCDVPLLYNEYALDVEGSELYGKNLSQLRVNIVESSKEQQYPEESHEKPHKNKRTAKAKTASNCDDNSDDVQVRWGDI
ncbi:PREDICTED: uncharacterized protein LOC106751890 isoform X2 [Dinoponera quadriceps]|uniref:Uncharacterized protein LOC106751890 isoform X2 n=1 Tax=Dinoponera quadriceps TaxID=609295 RepID=A0A6P3YC28_DINQU|nr:PREDICTED: uncharacterized protein LOC106751890 isoform X2 [Dinoponera quadriceps]